MLNRPLVPPLETFEEDRRLHNKCGWHVQLLYYGHAIVSVVVDFLGVLVGMLLFFYPQYHKGTSAYRQLFQVGPTTLPPCQPSPDNPTSSTTTGSTPTSTSSSTTCSPSRGCSPSSCTSSPLGSPSSASRCAGPS